MAVGSGGATWERGGVLASVAPKAPTRSVFNSVFYEDGDELLASRDELAEHYERSGIEAYGHEPGDFRTVADAPMSGLRIWFADLEGEPACTLAVWPHAGDAVVIWVAAVPEARGRGLSGRLLAHSLRAARDDGLETTTLQSTKLGFPVYAKLGYRDLGGAQMWERRKDGSAE